MTDLRADKLEHEADHYPDRWMILKIIEHHASGKMHYRVFATWGGSYLGGQSWQMNSGIKSVDEDNSYFYFTGASGSVYACYKGEGVYGAFSFGMMQLHNLMEMARGKIEVIEMPESTNWKGLSYD